MRKRSIGVSVLAFSTLMVALYCQYAAISLVVTGSVFAPSGQIAAFLTAATGIVFAGLTATSYVVGVALWMRKPWSRVWAVGIYLTFFVANAILSALAGNFGSSILPTIGVAAALVYLNRPQVRAELQGAERPTAVPPTAPAPTAERLEVPGPAR
jgi:hypothetical protein